MTGQILALDPNATYEAGEVAHLLFRVSLRSFKRQLGRRRNEGFPEPISRYGKKVWSGAALLAWRDRSQTGAEAGPGLVDFSEILARRAAKAAARRR